MTDRQGGLTSTGPPTRPQVRFSLRWKITLPYMLLALALGLGGTYLVGDFLATSSQERFVRQLSDSGLQVADGLVRTEEDLLEVVRLVANTQGVVEALLAQDAEAMRDRVVPLVVNAGVDLVAVLDEQGISLLTVRQRPGGSPGDYETLRGEAYYRDWETVGVLLSGASQEEKRAGLERLILGPTGKTDVFFIGGPILGSGGRTLGAVLVGSYLERMVFELRQQAGANISLYDRSGALLASSLQLEPTDDLSIPADRVEAVLRGSADRSPVRRIVVAGGAYGEILSPLLVRNRLDTLGIVGASLVEATVGGPGAAQPDAISVVLLGALVLLLVVVIGLLISNSITRPLVRMADASTAVATGNLDTRVPEGGGDEIGVLAATFNRMIEGLREGLIYHDLLGRAVTPEVREELRRSLAEGARTASVQEARATVLTAGLRGVGHATDGGNAEKLMESLGEFFAALVPLITHHGGVVYRFDGESTVALFGLLPRPVPAPVGAMQATHAALELVELVRRLNARREEAGLPPLSLGVGVATGRVVAGGLGTRDRIQYTVLGEAMEASLQLERVLRETEAVGVLISGEAQRALGGARDHFRFGRQGQAQVRGRRAPLEIIEVLGRSRRLLEAGGADFFDQTTESLG